MTVLEIVKQWTAEMKEEIRKLKAMTDEPIITQADDDPTEEIKVDANTDDLVAYLQQTAARWDMPAFIAAHSGNAKYGSIAIEGGPKPRRVKLEKHMSMSPESINHVLGLIRTELEKAAEGENEANFEDEAGMYYLPPKPPSTLLRPYPNGHRTFTIKIVPRQPVTPPNDA